MEFNQHIRNSTGGVRKEKISEKNKLSNDFISHKSQNTNNVSEEQSKQAQTQRNNRTYINRQSMSSYSTALVLSRIAYIMAGMAMQHAEQNRNNDRVKRQNAKFTAKNRQIHHEPEKLHHEPVQI